ncbi:MAG: FliI/YscN family ATPase, partial [Paracoccaceae bacterium]
MPIRSLDALRSGIGLAAAVRPIGRVTGVEAGRFTVSGLPRRTRLGDRVRVNSESGPSEGEVVAVRQDGAVVLSDASLSRVCMSDAVELLGSDGFAPAVGWIGRMIDPFGRPLDGRPLSRGGVVSPVRSAPPPAAGRRRVGARLATGTAVFDTLLPIARGQRIGLFAGSGVGKSSLLARFARGVEADLVVIALIGERGREVREFVEETLGPEGLARAVLVVATSDQSAIVRRRCAWAALAVAEFFRDRGMHVLLLADSVTRFAEAHREIALAAGENASLRGFPPSTAHEVMALAERAGPGRDDLACGDITAVFSVLVAGSDMDEPVADILRGTLDGHVVLDRAIAERGRFPAVDVPRSVSRSLPKAASKGENALIADARRMLMTYERAELILQAGLYAPGSDPATDRAIAVFGGLDTFLAEASPGGPGGAFARLAEVLG